jgi:hypothetical protein
MKWSEMQQNMCLGSNGLDRVCSLRQIITRLPCTNLCTNSPFGPFCIDFRAVMKRSETHQNMSLGSNGGGSVVFVAKESKATSSHELAH